MSNAVPDTARAFRKKLLSCIWQGAKMINNGFDPRKLAPKRDGITGQAGGTLSLCSLSELLDIAWKIKRQGGRIYVPRPPKGLSLYMATPTQLEAIHKLLENQNYLNNPDAFFQKRLGIKDPQNPTFKEAWRMLAYLHAKSRESNASQRSKAHSK